MNHRAEIIKLEWTLLPTEGSVLRRALRLLEERGFESAIAFLEGVAVKQAGQIKRGERVPLERAGTPPFLETDVCEYSPSGG